MKSLSSRSETDVSSGPPKLSLRLVLLLAGLLVLLHGGTYTPAPEPTAPLPDVQVVVTKPDWQLEVARESMAHAFSSLTSLEVAKAERIVRLVDKEASQYGINPFRILAFIVAESWGDSKARSHVGARGLMQIMPATGRVIARERKEAWGGIKSLYDIETNIAYGVWYYDHLLQVFEGDEVAAIAAYNWGPQHIRWRMKKGRRLPQVYPGKVLRAQKRLEREFSNEISTRYWRSFIENNPGPSGRGKLPGLHEDSRTASNIPEPFRQSLCLRCRGQVRPFP